MQARRIASLPLWALPLTLCLGCTGTLEAFHREHHFSRTKSTALILKPDQRVIVQRAVTADAQIEGRIQPEMIVCAEPSPDVANALSTALSGSLKAAPGAASSPSGSVELSHSRAESVVQLGSRIATIQLLRDELADLCRSYANGAVSTTTYTLRLSRLDKKMVTLLLSESAGRPGGSQAVLLGNSHAGTERAGTSDEVRTARQDAHDASTLALAKQEELQNAADADKAGKEREWSRALEDFEQKNLRVLAMERRFAQSGAHGEGRIVQVNSEPPETRASDVLPRLQQTFVDQDDLATILDACISSLDVLPLRAADSTRWQLLALRRAEVETAEAALLVEQKRAAVARASGADPEAEHRYTRAEESTAHARTAFSQALSELAPVSRFGEYCASRALDRLIEVNSNRMAERGRLLEQQHALIEAQSQAAKLRVCEVAYSHRELLDQNTRAACTAALSRETPAPTPIVTAVGPPAPR